MSNGTSIPLRIKQTTKAKLLSLSEKYKMREADIIESAVENMELGLSGESHMNLIELQTTATNLDISLLRLLQYVEMLEELTQDLSLGQFQPEDA